MIQRRWVINQASKESIKRFPVPFNYERPSPISHNAASSRKEARLKTNGLKPTP